MADAASQARHDELPADPGGAKTDGSDTDEETARKRTEGGLVRCGSPDWTGKPTWLHLETGTRLVRERRDSQRMVGCCSAGGCAPGHAGLRLARDAQAPRALAAEQAPAFVVSASTPFGAVALGPRRLSCESNALRALARDAGPAALAADAQAPAALASAASCGAGASLGPRRLSCEKNALRALACDTGPATLAADAQAPAGLAVDAGQPRALPSSSRG